MSVGKKVVKLSVNMPGDNICVDIFERADGSFGFEEFRRDPEDGRGWFPIGGYSQQMFTTLSEAKLAAQKTVRWFTD